MRCFRAGVVAWLLAGRSLGAEAADPLAAAESLVAQGEYEGAERMLAGVSGPSRLKANVALAKAALGRGRYAEADRLAAQATLSSAGLVRAEVAIAQGRLGDATRILERLVAGKDSEARRARLLLGETLLESGRRPEAEAHLHAIIEEYNNGSLDSGAGLPAHRQALAEVGRAAMLLRSPKDANQAFKESARVGEKSVETFLWASELFLDNYDPGHAEEEIDEALKLAPNHPDVLVQQARITLEQSLDFETAEKLVDRVLAINPHHLGALAVRASVALHDADLVRARRAIDDGLAVNPQDLLLLSLKATAFFLDEDKRGFETTKERVFALNPRYSAFYRVVADFAEWEHRYDDIVAMMKEATRVDPDDAKAWAQLGLTQLRGADEAEGLRSLRAAWAKDHFNVRVFNTLNLYERTIPNAYATVSEGIFTLRAPRKEQALLERYVPAMLHEGWASMKARYRFVPKAPIRVELYGSRSQFSVRTSGLPSVAIQGVCFGQVVAAVGPGAEPFNWGNVLWHELGHVFAIQLSKNRVPRWFTEGLSEYETIARRPEWARELDGELYDAIVANQLPQALDMNRAFTHAANADAVTVAYYASSQIVVWTVERFGIDAVSKALTLWGKGEKTNDVVREAFGTTPSEYDAGYRAWQLARLSRYHNQYRFALETRDVGDARRDADAAPALVRPRAVLAWSLLQAQKREAAKTEISRILDLDAGNADAYFMSAKIALYEGHPSVARQHLEAMIRAGHEGYAPEMMLADLAEPLADKSEFRFRLESAHRWDPSEPLPLRGLFKLAEHEHRDAEALQALRELSALDQHDRQAWTLLLDRLVRAELWAEARRAGEGALFVDVASAKVHILYARALSELGNHAQAAFELESALLCELTAADKQHVATLLSRERAALGAP